MAQERVAILGASASHDRFSNQAFHLLKEYHHVVLPIHPTLKSIDDVFVFASLSNVPGPIDTLTMYVGHAVSDALADEIIKAHPSRVIFNPGSENARLQAKLADQGIRVQEACTLVLLRTNQFE